jgi:hypothetical protein
LIHAHIGYEEAEKEINMIKCDVVFGPQGPIDVIENVEFAVVPRTGDIVIVPRHGVDLAWKVLDVEIRAKSSATYGETAPIQLRVNPWKPK